MLKEILGMLVHPPLGISVLSSLFNHLIISDASAQVDWDQTLELPTNKVAQYK